MAIRNRHICRRVVTAPARARHINFRPGVKVAMGNVDVPFLVATYKPGGYANCAAGVHKQNRKVSACAFFQPKANGGRIGISLRPQNGFELIVKRLIEEIQKRQRASFRAFQNRKGKILHVLGSAPTAAGTAPKPPFRTPEIRAARFDWRAEPDSRTGCSVESPPHRNS